MYGMHTGYKKNVFVFLNVIRVLLQLALTRIIGFCILEKKHIPVIGVIRALRRPAVSSRV